MDIAVDSAGNVYVTGHCFDSWLGPGNTPPIHDRSGYVEIFILKLNSSGTYQWHTYYGSSSSDLFGYISIDGADNLYITASSYISWLGDGDTDPLHSHAGGGMRDIVVIKLNSDGIYQWHTFYGSSGDDMGFSIVANEGGGSYLTGYSDNSWLGDGDVDPFHPYSGGYEIFVLKLDSNGVYQWHTFYGSSEYDLGEDIAVDPTGVYLTGYSYTPWQGDGNTNPLHPGTDGDTVVLKLDPSGTYQWHTFYGHSSHGYGISTDDSGLSISGLASISFLGDGDTGPRHPHSGNGDIFFLKLTPNGEYKWHTFYGSTAADYGTGIASFDHQLAFISGWSMATWSGDDETEPIYPYVGDDDIAVLNLFQFDAQVTIDPLTGGTVNFTFVDDSGIIVEVPLDAVTEEINLKLTEVSILTPPGGSETAGLSFDLDAYVGETLLPGFEFQHPISVTLIYSDSDIIGLDESSLLLYYWDDIAQAWTDAAETCDPTSSYTQSPEINTLSLPVCHLSRFGVFGVPLPPVEVFFPLIFRE